MKKVVDGPKELGEVALWFTKNVILGSSSGRKTALAVGLFGELGVGKTTFTEAVAKTLGIKDRILSPTFILERIYKLRENKNFNNFIHIDAYRLNGGQDLEPLGWNELVENPKNIIFIEWADRVKGILPKDTVKIHIEHKGGDKRKIVIES